ncbi:YfiR family protein [Enterobacteriaceae bacterium EKM102V]|nr:YfiR family protein [Enterobacteriaceae bacterium EKM102V]KAF6669728.1 YfiR family protein [Pantoea sp. EKM103V]
MTVKYPFYLNACLLHSLRPVCRSVLTLIILLLLIPHLAYGEIRDGKANRIVSGIISFSHWPGLNSPPQLCVFSSARHLSLPENITSPAATFTVVYIATVSQLATHRCDALYFGAETSQQQAKTIQQLEGRAVLTLAESSPECTVGAAFCLIFQPDRTLFSVNLDSLARSGVRVSPDVLLLSRQRVE